MNAKRTLLMLGLLAALPAMAADQQSTNVTATAKATATTKATVNSSKTLSNTQLQPVYPVIQYKLEDSQKKAPNDSDRISRYEGLSSQAWTTIATRQPGSFVFVDAKEHEPKFCLFSWGHKPW